MVKYADGPTTQVDVDIAAPPESVWPLLCDINLPGQFSQEFQRAEWADGADGAALGATFRGFNRHEVVGEWSVMCTITAFDVDQSFEWTVGDVENKAAKWRFDLAPTSTGSKLTFSAEMGPGQSGLTPAIERMPEREDDIVARRLSEWSDNMQRTIDGIRDLAETDGGAA